MTGFPFGVTHKNPFDCEKCAHRSRATSFGGQGGRFQDSLSILKTDLYIIMKTNIDLGHRSTDLGDTILANILDSSDRLHQLDRLKNVFFKMCVCSSTPNIEQLYKEPTLHSDGGKLHRVHKIAIVPILKFDGNRH